jgi:23S rRNA pseudouridine1911/1915/1917 synthase
MRTPPLDLLLDDADLVAVMKPAGLATIPGRAEDDADDNVLERVGRQLHLPTAGSADPRGRVVHRLDKDTSGVLLFAKHTAAQRHVCGQFHDNTTEKQYLALVAGRPDADEGTIDAPLGPHPNGSRRMAVVRKGGREAITQWRVEARYRDYTLLQVLPKTGRTHQIRVHLESIGLPLAIDPLYHPTGPGHATGIWLSKFKRDYRPNRHERERPLIDRLTLHAERLRVAHPSDGHIVELIAPPPKDFRATVNMLGRHSAR